VQDVWRTDDSGQTWFPVESLSQPTLYLGGGSLPPIFPSVLTPLPVFTNAADGWAVDATQVLHTTDSGDLWSPVTVPLPPGAPISGWRPQRVAAFGNAVVAEYLTEPSEPSILPTASTGTGGTGTGTAPVPCSVLRRAATPDTQVPSFQTSAAQARTPCIHIRCEAYAVSTDGGRTWASFLSPIALAPVVFTRDLAAVYGWVYHPSYTPGAPTFHLLPYYRSTDLGLNWTTLPPPSFAAPGNLNSSSGGGFLNGQIGWTLVTQPAPPGGCRAGPMALERTTDGGQTWQIMDENVWVQ
jgi:hypothetical protein